MGCGWGAVPRSEMSGFYPHYCFIWPFLQSSRTLMAPSVLITLSTKQGKNQGQATVKSILTEEVVGNNFIQKSDISRK